MITKPLLAQNIQEDKLKFHSCGYIMQCKIDGSFMLIQEGKALARSLKQHENKFITNFYSNPLFNGLRGEIIVGDNPVAEGLCRDTSSALRRIDGEPQTTFWVFDYVTEDTKDLPYKDRLGKVYLHVEHLSAEGFTNFKIVPSHRVFNIEQYNALKSAFMEAGYEGCIIRHPELPHKEGRSSTTKAHLWRWKPWLDAEILVTGITEGRTNLNEATTNELGRTKRSTHQENMQPNGQVGTLQGNLLKDLLDCNGKVIQNKGSEVTISAGEMTAKERKYYFENQQEIIGSIAKFKYFAYGLKETVRMPIFLSIRSSNDMS